MVMHVILKSLLVNSLLAPQKLKLKRKEEDEGINEGRGITTGYSVYLCNIIVGDKHPVRLSYKS